jgi:hypothetical protein
MFRRARDLYHDPLLRDHSAGHFFPAKMAEMICRRPPPGFSRVIKQVRVYTGQPDSTKEPTPYAAHRRQTQTWRDRRIHVITRPLRYPRDWPKERPQEKGIDVALAIDFVAMAFDREHDVGILASTDTDLKPALEFVIQRCPGVRAEVVSWGSPTQHCSRLSIPGRKIWCHWLQVADYTGLSDAKRYVP